MESFKKYIAHEFVGKKLHFKCDCLLKLNHIGVIVDFEMVANEIVFIVDVDGKIIRIGENHPNLYVEEA